MSQKLGSFSYVKLENLFLIDEKNPVVTKGRILSPVALVLKFKIF